MEIPSSHAGVVQALRVQIGDQVKQGGAGAGSGRRHRRRACCRRTGTGKRS